MRERHAVGVAKVAIADQLAVQRAGSRNIAFDDEHRVLSIYLPRLAGAGLARWSRGMTSFKADHVSSMAQTLMSTSPSDSAVSRTTFSVTSVATPEDFFGHDTHTMPPGAIASRQAG